jgi:hypothetical protein
MELSLCNFWSENDSASIEGVVRKGIALVEGESRKSKGLLAGVGVLRKRVRKYFFKHFLSKAVLIIIH